MNGFHLYGALAKIDAETRTVWGYASTEAKDNAGEIILKTAIEEALPDYLEWGAVREMHQLSAVGKTVEAAVDEKGLYIGAKIVDDAAWSKVVAAVYKGFSVGGRTLARDPKNKSVITKLLLTEISLVDRPANPEARFDVWKAASGVRISRASLASIRNIGALGPPGSGSPLEKAQTPRQFLAAYDRLHKLGDDARAMQDSPEKADALAKVSEALIAVRTQELRAIAGGGR